MCLGVGVAPASFYVVLFLCVLIGLLVGNGGMGFVPGIGRAVCVGKPIIPVSAVLVDFFVVGWLWCISDSSRPVVGLYVNEWMVHGLWLIKLTKCDFLIGMSWFALSFSKVPASFGTSFDVFSLLGHVQ